MELISEIMKVAEHNYPNWDGDGAEPISPVAVETALFFAENYNGFMQFEASPDPDGSVELEATFPNGCAILSFLKDERVAYFIRVGENKHRGTCEVARVLEILEVFE